MPGGAVVAAPHVDQARGVFLEVAGVAGEGPVGVVGAAVGNPFPVGAEADAPFDLARAARIDSPPRPRVEHRVRRS